MIYLNSSNIDEFLGQLHKKFFKATPDFKVQAMKEFM